MYDPITEAYGDENRQKQKTYDEALGVINDCYKVLISSGQLEVSPPRSLNDFVRANREKFEELFNAKVY